MRNPFHMLEKRNRRLWALFVLVPFVFATVVLLPLAILRNLIANTPWVLSNLWGDIRPSILEPTRYLGKTWAIWWESVSGKADREARRQEEVMATYDSSPIEAIKEEVHQ